MTRYSSLPSGDPRSFKGSETALQWEMVGGPLRGSFVQLQRSEVHIVLLLLAQRERSERPLFVLCELTHVWTPFPHLKNKGLSKMTLRVSAALNIQC